MGNCCTGESKYISDDLLITPRDLESTSDKKDTLETVDPDTIEFIPHKKEIIEAKVVDVYDGDTCTIIYSYGSEFLKTKIRVIGVDTPEMSVRGELRGTDIGNLEQKAGTHVKKAVIDLIEGKILKVKMNKFDKYGGRINGDIYLELPENFTPDKDGTRCLTLTDFLISKKYARKYSGDKKEAWTEEELNYILEN